MCTSGSLSVHCVAFLFGWSLFLVIDSGAIAVLAVAFASNYLPYFIAMSPLTQKLVALLFIAVHVAINYVGVKWGALVQNILMVVNSGSSWLSLCWFHLRQREYGQFCQAGARARSPPGLLSSFRDRPGGLPLGLQRLGVRHLQLWGDQETGKEPSARVVCRDFAGALFVICITNLAYLYIAPTSQNRKIAEDRRRCDEPGNRADRRLHYRLRHPLQHFSAPRGPFVMTSPRVYFAMARDGLFFQKIAAVHPKYSRRTFRSLPSAYGARC